MPKSAEFDALVTTEFSGYRLQIGGLVENPVELSFAELEAMPNQEQITTHFCIQGCSGVAKWGGVPMCDILDLVKPTLEARFAVLSFADGGDGGRYYDTHSLANMRHKLTILAYEMSGAPSAFCMARRCGCAAKTSLASKWSSGSRLSNSCTTTPISVPAKAVTTRIMNTTATGCRSN